MKKLYFFCIALVALMLASCGGKDYREMLPADSFVIVSINPESLSRKAQVGDFTQSVYYKMAEQALADAPEEERGRILSLLAHPSETGLDVGSDVFMFVTMENASQTGNPTVGGLFNVVAPTLRAAKRRIYKLEILQPFTAEQRIPLKEGYQVVYNLEMIFALAFQINTYPAQQLREYIISRLFQSEKSMVICMVNGNHKSYLKC